MSGLMKTGLTALAAMLALAAALALGEAQAADAAVPAGNTAGATAAPAPAGLPLCWPANVGGSGTPVTSFSNRNGQAFGWWCTDAQGVARVQWFAAPHGFRFTWPANLAGTPQQVAQAMWEQNVKAADSLSPELFALRAALREQLAATQPPPAAPAPAPLPAAVPAYAVMALQAAGAPAGQAGVSLLNNGALTPLSSAVKTAAWGVACDCSKGKFVAADQAFCPYGGQTVYVARCKAR